MTKQRTLAEDKWDLKSKMIKLTYRLYNTGRWSDSGVYCTNLVLTDSEEKAEEHYSKYEMVSIRFADEWEVDSYRSRGCPVVEL